MRARSCLFFASIAALLSAACGDAPDTTATDSTQQEGPRGPLGKADATGSCKAGSSGDFCGKKGSGSCYCDDGCKGYGDCCTDYEPVCKGSAPPSGSDDAVSCEDAGNICNLSPAGAAVYRLYREAVRADGLLSEVDAQRMGAFVRGSAEHKAAVSAFLGKVIADPKTKFDGKSKQILEGFQKGTPPSFVPAENQVYKLKTGTQASSVLDDSIYLVGDGTLSGSINSSSYSRGYAKKADGILRFPHGSKAPAHLPVDSADETQRLRNQSPAVALDLAAGTAGLQLGQFGFDYRAQKRFYDSHAQYWEGLCHAWSYGALDERINALVDVDGIASKRGVWIFGQWLSRADLGNWMMAVSDQLSVADTELVDPFVTPRDILLGVTQWVMTSGLGLRADMFNDVEKGSSEVWNQPIIAADMKVSTPPPSVADAIFAYAKTDTKNTEALPASPKVKLVQIRAYWGAEIDDAHEGAPGIEVADWNMYFVLNPDGKAVVGYMAHHLAAKVAGLPVKDSDPLPDYFAYPKNQILDAAFEGKPSTMLKGALDGSVFRFFVGTVLSYGVPETMRTSFESDVKAGVDVALLKKKYPGIANAYSKPSWDASFSPKLGAGTDFGAQWGKFANPG
ncbi:MAG: hypothetical protein HY898_04985 [Deltaproteobacteria bacterium]|nr:hypothetical protein [Deltaproteobacteria bacterium]